MKRTIINFFKIILANINGPKSTMKYFSKSDFTLFTGCTSETCFVNGYTAEIHLRKVKQTFFTLTQQHCMQEFIYMHKKHSGKWVFFNTLGIACSVHIQKECIHFPFLYGFHFRKCFRFWHLASTQIWQILVANHKTNGNIDMFLRIAGQFADLNAVNLKQQIKKITK